MEYEAIDGTEQARLFRDRLRGLEQRHVQLEAAKIAGDDVSDDEVKDVEERIATLKRAASDATSKTTTKKESTPSGQ